MAQTLQLTNTLQRITTRAGLRTLDTVFVFNDNGDAIYLNLWDDAAESGTPGQVIADVTDQLPIAAGYCGAVLIGRYSSGSFVLSASTSRDGTGAPTTPVEVGGLRWVG